MSLVQRCERGNTRNQSQCGVVHFTTVPGSSRDFHLVKEHSVTRKKKENIKRLSRCQPEMSVNRLLKGFEHIDESE